MLEQPMDVTWKNKMKLNWPLHHILNSTVDYFKYSTKNVKIMKVYVEDILCTQRIDLFFNKMPTMLTRKSMLLTQIL